MSRIKVFDIDKINLNDTESLPISGQVAVLKSTEAKKVMGGSAPVGTAVGFLVLVGGLIALQVADRDAIPPYL
jgi:hypothetical protein